ncbi:MAG: hypothetical protein E7345_05325 [Clostridiales bacterium]|nr:hypothetical protein [Clostridiales bacterium]
METKQRMISTKYVLKQKQAKARRVAIVAICSLLTVVGFSGKLVYDNIVNKPDDLADMLKFLKESNAYKCKMSQEEECLCEELCEGDINYYEYSKEYKQAMSEEAFINWARTLDNAEVQSVISDYDNQMREYEKKVVGDLAGIGLGLSATVASGMVFNKKTKECEEFERKNRCYLPR